MVEMMKWTPITFRVVVYLVGGAFLVTASIILVIRLVDRWIDGVCGK